MRPLYLKVEGVKSIAEEQSINFEQLSKNGIFGIFGKTGSGKSTILDSIVLAIYGEIISNVDNSDFINNSKDRARVELTFSILSQGKTKKYKIERQYKFSGKNRNLTSNAKLWEITELGDYCIAEGSKSVSDKLKEDIIGLTKSEFLKCIALPQGEFSSFIKMTRNERLLIIGKLFDLEKYGKKLYHEFKNQDDEYAKEEIKLLGRIEGLENCSSEDVKNFKSQLQQVTEELKKLEKERSEQDKKCEELNLVKKLIEERAKKSDEKTNKLTYKPTIEQYKCEIEQFDRVKLVQKDLLNYDNLLQEITTEEQKLESLNKENKQLLLKKEKSDKEKQNLPNIQEKLVNAQIALSNLESIKGDDEKLKKKEEELAKLRNSHSEISAKIKNNEISINLKNSEGKKLDEMANKIDIEHSLSILATQISGSAISTFASERLNFLNSLSQLIAKNKVENSEIRALIDEEREKIIKLTSVEEQPDVKLLLESLLKDIEDNAKYSKYAQECFSQVKSLKEQNEEQRKKLLEITERELSTRAEYDELKVKIQGVLKGKTLEEVKEELTSEVKEINEKIKQINADYEAIGQLINKNSIDIATVNASYNQHKQTEKSCKLLLANALEKFNLTFEEGKALLKREEEIERVRAIVNNYEQDLSLIEKRLGELNELLKNNQFSLEQIENEKQNLEKMKENCQKIAKKCGEINNTYVNSLKNNKDWCIINNNLKDISENRKSIGKMLELVRENRFMEFIAEEYLKDIASIAESRVLSLTSGRYGLQYKNGAFYVADNLNGGKLRPAMGLSGGETFLVSLSLALALSSQISSKALRPLDFFFLDEGFGTLDDDLIDAVTDSLEKLQKANLTVGLITHVGELKNRIQSRIEVTGATALHGTLISSNY